ncbi:MAG TPA: hypothetical protein VEK82_05790 [Stellaceae bacterium]|nr:hypothetical protein [Stellaceae bacterium]
MLMIATPALAQPPMAPRELMDPRVTDQVTDAMQAVTQAVLDLHVGEVQAAIDGRRPTASDRRLTVRDLGRRDDPNFDRNIEQGIANTRPVIRQSVRAVNDALPAVLQAVDQAQQAIERAVANLPDPTYPRR